MLPNSKYKPNVNNVIPLIITNKFTYIKFHIKTLKIAPTCFDPNYHPQGATLFLAKVILKTFTK